jgi:hypothetical protein
VPDVPVDTILLGLVEDFVPTAGVEPVVQREVAFRHLPGDKALDRGGFVANGVVGSGDGQDRQLGPDPLLVFGGPRVAESLDHRICHLVGERLAAQWVAPQQPDVLSVAGPTRWGEPRRQ